MHTAISLCDIKHQCHLRNALVGLSPFLPLSLSAQLYCENECRRKIMCAFLSRWEEGRDTNLIDGGWDVYIERCFAHKELCCVFFFLILFHLFFHFYDFCICSWQLRLNHQSLLVPGHYQTHLSWGQPSFIWESILTSNALTQPACISSHAVIQNVLHMK